jgi:hypothetical protein
MADPFPYASTLYNIFNPPSPPPEDDPYFAAYGRFIANYAAAEQAVHFLARRLSRLTDAKARIIFSGMRLSDLAERVRGLLRVTNSTSKKYNEIDACLTQLDLISDERNKLIHRWVIYSNRKIWVSNVATAKIRASFEVVSFDIDDFKHMNDDCLAISFRLTRYIGQYALSRPSRKSLAWARSPWRYKRTAPNTPQKQRQKAPRSPRPRPAASGGSP